MQWSLKTSIVKLSVFIRNTTHRDAPLIADLSHQTFIETFASRNTRENMDKFLKEQFSKELLMQEVGDHKNVFLLAFYNQEPAGYARLRENNNPPELQHLKTLEIARIYVLKKFIGKGVGKMLMQKSLAMALRQKVDAVWLGVWEQNLAAINFYQSWGFKKFATHIFMLGSDAQTDWLMKKDMGMV